MLLKAVAFGIVVWLLTACAYNEAAVPTLTPQGRIPTAEMQPTVTIPKPLLPASSAGNCSRCYPQVCLKMNAGDYDCAGGSGNGPNYVSGPVEVAGCDPFGLDRDRDGWGCE